MPKRFQDIIRKYARLGMARDTQIKQGKGTAEQLAVLEYTRHKIADTGAPKYESRKKIYEKDSGFKVGAKSGKDRLKFDQVIKCWCTFDTKKVSLDRHWTKWGTPKTTRFVLEIEKPH